MRPTTRCLLLFAAGFPLAALPAIVAPGLWSAWVMWIGAAALLTGVDAILGLPARRLGVDLHAPETLYVGDAGTAEITLTPHARSGTRQVEVLCDLSDLLVPQPSGSAPLTGAGPTRHEVTLAPVRRGTGILERIWLRWSGPLGLMNRRLVVAENVALPIVPNIHAVRGAALQWARERDASHGQHSVRFVGEGSEFDAMREYVRGLDHRAINWRATARHRTLICQEFRAERNHQIVVALDSGHLMSEPLDGMPKLDHAIHTGLLLAHTCLRTGDKVGMFSFDDGARTFVAPEGGMRGFRRLQHASAEIAYTAAETNFTLGLAQLAARLHRRSLVVLLTDFVDTVTAELMVENITRLARRHLLVFVTLRDPHLEASVTRPPTSVDSLYRSVVAGDFVRERDLVLRRLQRLGVFTIDATPDAVSTQLLNRYFAIKRRELI